MVELAQTDGEIVSRPALKYVNRLSDFLFVASRFLNARAQGDVLWVPTWTWHRVDYLPNVTALSVSLFHVRAEQLAAAQPLLTAAMVPALLKELVGWKTQ